MRIHFLGPLAENLPIGFTTRLVEIGRLVRAKGVKGEVKLLPGSPSPPDLVACGRVFLWSDSVADTPPSPHEVLACGRSGGALVLRVSGIDSRDKADGYKDWLLGVALTDIPRLADDGVYWHNLQGVSACLHDGELVGVLSGYMFTAALPLIKISALDGREHLIPVHPDFLFYKDATEHDPACVVLTPPPGLLELGC